MPSLTGHFSAQAASQFRPVDNLDHIEQRHRIRGLVGLQRANQMELQIRIEATPFRPALLRLLNPVFPENTVPGHQRGLDPVIRLALADGNEGRCGAGIVLARRVHARGNGPEVASNFGTGLYFN